MNYLLKSKTFIFLCCFLSSVFRLLPTVFCLLSTILYLLSANPAYAAWTDGQAADVVLGQADFTSNASGTTASTMNDPNSICLDPSSNKVFVVDGRNHRVLRFSSADALVNGSSAEGVLGQSDFTSNGTGTTASTMSEPKGCAIGSEGRLWVGDEANHRVLRFDNAASKANGADADGVLGQPDFTSNGSGTTASSMNAPNHIYEKSGRLWVPEAINDRVLRFDNAASKANGANADGVLGQSDFTSGGLATTASGMNFPVDVVEDSNGALFVAEMNNRRVLRFDNAASKANGANADGVLGQSDFTSNGAGTTANTMRNPSGLAIDGSNGLYVTDRSNNRILIFNNASGKSDGASADNVLGQTDFTSSGTGITASTLNNPHRGAFDTTLGRLWVADVTNNRVLSYSSSGGSSSSEAIPTMSEWTMIIFMILTGIMAVYYLKKNEQWSISC